MQILAFIFASLIFSAIGLPRGLVQLSPQVLNDFHNIKFQEPEECTVCKENIKKLMDHAMDREPQQEYLLIYTVFIYACIAQ